MVAPIIGLNPQKSENTEEDTQTLLSFGPSRLSHGTFLSPAARDIVLREKMPIEMCLTSNLLYVSIFILTTNVVFIALSCKTVKTIDAHHIRYFLKRNHPIAICVCHFPVATLFLLIHVLDRRHPAIPHVPSWRIRPTHGCVSPRAGAG